MIVQSKDRSETIIKFVRGPTLLERATGVGGSLYDYFIDPARIKLRKSWVLASQVVTIVLGGPPENVSFELQHFP